MEFTSPPTNPLTSNISLARNGNLQRDKEQSLALHKPGFRIMKTDPISGHDVGNYLDHCSLIDGNLTIYFDTQENCKTFKAMPFDHPNLHLLFPLQWMTIVAGDDGEFCKGEMIRCGLFSMLQI